MDNQKTGRDILAENLGVLSILDVQSIDDCIFSETLKNTTQMRRMNKIVMRDTSLASLLHITYYYCMCGCCVGVFGMCGCMCATACVAEVRGQLLVVGSLPPSFCGF